jgi:dTDP-4-amino-4,6-dideoxygalactose transaminase
MLKHKFTTNSLSNITQVIHSGNMGYGPLVKELEKKFALVNNQYNIATNSASAAAFMIFAYLKEKYGECDVYVPSLTFTSPVWAAKHLGHRIIFVDVDNELLFDFNDYLKKSKLPSWRIPTGRKKVIMPTLYGGVSNIDNGKLKGDEIIVIDSAHCPFPTLKYDFAFTSFHPTKPICSPDGGMIFTPNKEAANYFYSYRNFGRENLNKGYDITQNGFKFYMNNLSASIILESLKEYSKNLETRKKNFILIKDKFEGRFLKHDENSSYYFATIISDQAEYLNNKYKTSKHYPLLHKTSYYENCNLSNTEYLSPKIVNLPLYDINIYNS